MDITLYNLSFGIKQTRFWTITLHKRCRQHFLTVKSLPVASADMLLQPQIKIEK